MQGRGEVTVRTPGTGPWESLPCSVSDPRLEVIQAQWVLWTQGRRGRDAAMVSRMHLLCLVLGGRVLSQQMGRVTHGSGCLETVLEI